MIKGGTLCMERGHGCHFYADRDEDEPGVGPICERCYRRLHPVHTPRPAGSRGAPAHIRRRVLDRDHRLCQLRDTGCLGTATEVDHLRNVASVLRAGGTKAQADNLSNLMSVCRPCHKIKSDRERNEAVATANRRRAVARLEKLGRKPRKHPGDD